jgi:hypothetical protein
MSYSRRIVAAVATLIVLVVVVPAGAEAKSLAVASQGASVQVSVDRAVVAVKRMTRYARLGRDVAAARQLKVARSQTAAASRVARAMAASAGTGAEGIAAAQALTLVGVQYDDLAEAVSALVSQVTGQAQAQFVNAIVPSLGAKQKVLEMLSALLDGAPVQAKPVIAAIIAVLAATDPAEVINLKAALDSGKLPIDVAVKISEALAVATAFYETAFTMVTSIVALLPKEVQAPLLQILDVVTLPVGSLKPSELSIVTALIAKVLGSLPFAGGTLPASHGLPGLSGLAGTFSAIVGSSQSLPGGVSDKLDALLPGLFGGPAGGDLGETLSSLLAKIVELIQQLLGGIGAPHAAGAT